MSKNCNCPNCDGTCKTPGEPFDTVKCGGEKPMWSDGSPVLALESEAIIEALEDMSNGDVYPIETLWDGIE